MISIWAVNGCQSEALVIGKFKVNCQGFVAKASLSVMILKSLFLYSLFTTRPCFTRMATPPFWPVERSLLIVS